MATFFLASTYGNFTQLVCTSSREIGVGYAESSDNMHYIVAYYYPRGNVGYEFKSNVFKPLST